MPVLSDKELFQALKEKKLAPVYFLYGAEGYFVTSALNQIIRCAVEPAFESFNLKRFQWGKTPLTEIEDACEALPMMAASKCVAVCDVDAEKLTQEERERLFALMNDLPEGTVLVFYQDAVLVDCKRSAKWKKFAETAAKAGVSCEFALKDKLTLRRALCDRAKKLGGKMNVDAASALCDRCSHSYSILMNEQDKLLAYADGREITTADVDECCVRSIEASAFDLAKNILSGNYDRACHILDELFFLRQEAVSILGALSMAFADIYRAKCAVAAKRTVEETAKEFRYPKNRMFAVKNAYRDVLSFSTGHIRCCLDALYTADRKLKSTRIDDRLVLEQMLGEMRQSARENR